ncbi:MAG: PD40 domain-containing protein, partial [Acidobacteria bacterium]|nr:PD40 domain-containing protein [Acidobacteriota bacterium]
MPAAARFMITASQSGSFTPDTFGSNIAIAPDGLRIAYTVIHNGVPELAVRRLDSLEETPLAGTEGGTFPFFSPDSQQIGYATLEAIKRVPADGGASVTISPTDAGFRGATWGVDDTIVFARDAGAGLLRVSASGGKPQPIAATRVAARKLGGRDVTTLAEGGIGPQYMPPGYVIFAHGERLMAIRFNGTTLATTGSPVAVQENAFTKIGDGVANLALAGDGTAVFIAGHNPGSLRRLAWVTRKGEQVGPAFEEPVEYARNPRISPDGHKVALTIGTSGHADIWVYDLDRAAQPLKLTSQNHNTFPSWSADGKRIVFVSISTAGGYMFSIASDGSVLQPERVVNGEAGDLPLAMAPDGASLLFRRNDDLWQLDLHNHSQRPVVQTPFSEHSSSFSPNGHWIAYSSNQTGRMEIWVRPIADPGAPVRVSSDGGHDPVWSRGGKEIFFENSGTLMSAQVLSDA